MSQKCDCEGAGDDMDGITSAVRIPLWVSRRLWNVVGSSSLQKNKLNFLLGDA